MDKLPKILTNIESENDYEQLTPLMRVHKKKLAEYGSQTNEMTKAQELKYRQEFVSYKNEYTNVYERNIFMAYILNNMGLGPGSTLRTAEQVRKISDHHKDKINKHLRKRIDLIDNNKPIPPLN